MVNIFANTVDYVHSGHSISYMYTHIHVHKAATTLLHVRLLSSSSKSSGLVKLHTMHYPPLPSKADTSL